METIPISIPSNLWYIARPDLANMVDLCVKYCCILLSYLSQLFVKN